MSDEQLERIAEQLNEIDQNLTNEFIKSNNKEQWLRNNASILEGYSDYTDKYSNIEDFIGDRYTRLSKFYKELDGEQPSKARMQSFLEKNPDISAKDVNEWFIKSNNYKEDYIKERQMEADRFERIKEVKDLPWYKDVFTSDYSKQRYIDDPTTSILGGSQFNPYSKEGQSEIRDAILGTTAGLADVIPTPLQTQVWLGPAIRGGRDVYHGESDESYKPEGTKWSDYAKRALTDAGANAAFEYTPNWLARKLSRIERGAGEQLNKYIAQPYMDMKLNKETALINDSYNEVNKLLESNIEPLEMVNQIKSLPDSEYKQALLSNIDLQRGSIPSQIKQQQLVWKQQLNPSTQEAFATLRNEGKNIQSVGAYAKEPSDYFLRSSTRPKLNKFQTIESKLMGIGSDAVIPSTKPFIRPEIKVTDDNRHQIDWFKDNYARDWKLGFEPVYNEEDPKWLAFEEMYPERAAIIKQKALEK